MYCGERTLPSATNASTPASAGISRPSASGRRAAAATARIRTPSSEHRADRLGGLGDRVVDAVGLVAVRGHRGPRDDGVAEREDHGRGRRLDLHRAVQVEGHHAAQARGAVDGERRQADQHDGGARHRAARRGASLSPADEPRRGDRDEQQREELRQAAHPEQGHAPDGPVADQQHERADDHRGRDHVEVRPDLGADQQRRQDERPRGATAAERPHAAPAGPARRAASRPRARSRRRRPTRCGRRIGTSDSGGYSKAKSR